MNWGAVMNTHVKSRKLLNRVQTLSKAISSVSTGIGAGLMGLMFVSIVLAVIFRYVLLNPLPWTDEVAIYCNIWIGFLGIGVAIKTDSHPYMEFIMKKFSKKVQRIVALFVDLLVLAFFVVVTIWGFRYALTSGKIRTSYSLGISMQLPMLAVPIGALLAVLQVCLRNIERFLEGELDAR